MPEIGIAADHGGFLLKEELKDSLQKLGYELTDFGAFELDQEDDYPESILPLARALSEGKVKKGIAVCGDRKSTRLNSSHVAISYAVFCLKKKKLESTD